MANTAPNPYGRPERVLPVEEVLGQGDYIIFERNPMQRSVEVVLGESTEDPDAQPTKVYLNYFISPRGFGNKSAAGGVWRVRKAVPEGDHISKHGWHYLRSGVSYALTENGDVLDPTDEQSVPPDRKENIYLTPRGEGIILAQQADPPTRVMFARDLPVQVYHAPVPQEAAGSMLPSTGQGEAGVYELSAEQKAEQFVKGVFERLCEDSFGYMEGKLPSLTSRGEYLKADFAVHRAFINGSRLRDMADEVLAVARGSDYGINLEAPKKRGYVTQGTDDYYGYAMTIDSSPTIPGFLNVYFGLPAIVKGEERFHSDNFALVIPEVVHVNGVTVDIRASLHANPYTGVKLLEEFFPRVFGADPALSAQRLPAHFIVIDDRQDPGGPQETPYTQPYNPEQLTDQKIEEFLRTTFGQGRPLW